MPRHLSFSLGTEIPKETNGLGGIFGCMHRAVNTWIHTGVGGVTTRVRLQQCQSSVTQQWEALCKMHRQQGVISLEGPLQKNAMAQAPSAALNPCDFEEIALSLVT